MSNHSRHSRGRRDKGRQDLIATLDAAIVPTGGSKQAPPSIFCPKTWTPEWCREQAKGAEQTEDYGLAREWRIRALVLERYTEVRLREPNRTHPYRDMKVDMNGREVTELTITPAMREALMGAMENQISGLPDTE